MTTHLEYKDEKSAKFWKITVESNTHRVTYGKIGTDGQSKTKTFESAEKALQEAQKLIKAKTKKGYQEVISQPKKTISIDVQLINEPKAVQLFDIDQYKPLNDIDCDTILLVEGDLVLEDDLNEAFIKKHFWKDYENITNELIVINGDLMIYGDLDINGETGYPCLLVLGDLYCECLYSFDNFMHIAGNAYIKYAYYGSYNHGAIKIVGTTNAPYIINDDHHSDLNPSENALLINSSGRQDDFFEYHYYRDDLPMVLLQSVSNFKIGTDKEDYDFDCTLFMDTVKKGISPFKQGAKPEREAIADEISSLAIENETNELFLIDKRLRNIPPALFQLTNLKRLTIEEDDISILSPSIGQLTLLQTIRFKKIKIERLPESIGNLAHLEELQLMYCYNLKDIPETINQLQCLKVLNLIHSYALKKLPKTIGHLKHLEELNLAYSGITALPQSIGLLENLKILNLSNCHQLLMIPSSIGQLNKLQKIDLRNYKGEIPDSIYDLPQIDELEILI